MIFRRDLAHLGRPGVWSDYVINRFFKWLETRVDPFPPARPEMPPQGLLRFAWYYTKPFWPLLLAAMLFSGVIAFLEVYLFAFLGDLVDLLAEADRATFWQTHGLKLAAMGAIVLLALPVLNFISESISHQGLRGNYAMRTPLDRAPLCAASVHGLLHQ